uniref:Uncharacterized protein n=1 Tax=Globisporangium ultimum (strain ATCC 200006 / CBS 805.95 / DAOM BR144) TaxID=431595 RepID=K3WE42_GLOUD
MTAGCWQSICGIFKKPFKKSSYKVRKTQSDPLEVEFSQRPKFAHSPNSLSRSAASNNSQPVGSRVDRFSGGFQTTVSSTSSCDAETYETEYRESFKNTDFMFYCGSDTPTSDAGQRNSFNGAASFSSTASASEFSEAAEVASEERAKVATPKISHQIPVFFSPRNALPMPTPKRKETPMRPMRMANTRVPTFINVKPVKGRGQDAL